MQRKISQCIPIASDSSTPPNISSAPLFTDKVSKYLSCNAQKECKIIISIRFS